MFSFLFFGGLCYLAKLLKVAFSHRKNCSKWMNLSEVSIYEIGAFAAKQSKSKFRGRRRGEEDEAEH